MKTNPLWRRISLYILLITLLLSCRKSDDHPNYPAGSQENINSWILDSMKVYYYWNSALPKNPSISQDPPSFFNAIKSKGDRFSALVNPDFPETYPPSLVHVLGFDLLTLQLASGAVETVVSLVVPGSRGASLGILRGDVIKTINGTAPTAANITALTKTIVDAQTATLEIAGRDGTLIVTKLNTSEVPVYTYTSFQSGGKTYGYLFLNSFEDAALSQLKQAFSYFKQQQVQELLLDLRYNPGGSVPVASALAAMISPNVTAGNTFVEYRGNSNAGVTKSSFATELGRLPVTERIGFAQFSNYRLGLNKVHIFTGSHTASAAELLINALKPYLTVVQVGQQTLGKDMASFLIKDYRDPQVVPHWEIYPMIYKLYNASGIGDYSNGITPDQLVDELAALPLKPFGDLADPLIQKCLGDRPAAVTAKIREYKPLKSGTILYDSRTQLDMSSNGPMILRPQ
jgi:carboxyl-terminal processing protease